jgi:hypothetical protein
MLMIAAIKIPKNRFIFIPYCDLKVKPADGLSGTKHSQQLHLEFV